MRLHGAMVALLAGAMPWGAALAGDAAGSTQRTDDGYARLEGHGGPIMGIAIAPGRGRALTASFDYSVGLWDLMAGGEPTWLEGHRAAANAVAFLPRQRGLSAGDDGALILWDLTTGEAVRRFTGHRGKVNGISVTPDGRAASAGWDGRIGLWTLAEAGAVRWIDGHDGPVNDVVFSAAGDLLYSAGHDGTIRVWQAATGRAVRTLVKHGFGVNRLALSADGTWLAYGAVDGAVRVRDLESDAEVADLTADRRPILALSLSPGHTHLAVGDGEGHVLLIETATWTIVRDFRAAIRGPVWALAWTGDGRVVSGGLDDAAAIWPVAADEAQLAGRLSTGEQKAQREFQRDPAQMTNGERQFARKCSICHTLTPDGARRAGPSLWGVFGREAGSLPGHGYSPALADSRIVWTAETIDRLFAEGPDHVTPGSKMPMQRIAEAEDRADLIGWLARNTGPRAAPADDEKEQTR